MKQLLNSLRNRMLLEICCLVVIIYFNVRNTIAKEPYEENVDELFETMLGKLYKVSHNFTIPTKFATNMKKNGSKHDYYDYNIWNTEIPQFAFKNTTFNAAMEYLNTKRIDKNIDELLKAGNNHIPNFQNDVDEIGLITRRFDKIRLLSTKTRRDGSIEGNRQHVERYGTMIKNLMLQFIYETRYRLPYAQLLRKKYKDKFRYKLGYCFALLRNLKQQQMLLYTGLKNWNVYFQHQKTLNFDIKIYEKVIRLDVDIKDLIKLMKKMEYDRKMIEDPTYYDDDITTKKSLFAKKVNERGSMRFGGQGITRPRKYEKFFTRFRGENQFRSRNPRFEGLGTGGYESRRLYSADQRTLKHEDPASDDLSFRDRRSSQKSRFEHQGFVGRRSFGSVESGPKNIGSATLTSGWVSPKETSKVSVPTTTPKPSRYSRLWSAGFGL